MENKIEKRKLTFTFKKVFSLLLAIVMLFSITAGIDLSAYAYEKITSGDYKYSILDDGTIRITKYIGTDTAIIIPSEIDGKTVTSLSGMMFSSHRDSLTSVIIPNTVTEIDGTFTYCKNLESVTLGNNITSIVNNTFDGCTSLTSITIPDSVTSIGNCAFRGCSLTSITIPNSVETIKGGAFMCCYSLENITIGNSVKTIDNRAFYDCTSLDDVTIPNNITSIGSEAFRNCSSLSNITIPNGVTSISDKTFYDCAGLTSVTIKNGATSIGNSAFENCKSLVSVNIPNAEVHANSSSFIGSRAFDDCKSLTNITISDSVTSIGQSAFCNCASLKSLKIGNSVTKIGDYAFMGCSGLKEITIPNSVTKIGYDAFCKSLIIVDSVVYYNGTINEWNALYEANYYYGSNDNLFTSTILCSDGVLNCRHKFDNGKITKAETCTENGVKTYTCTICDETKTEIIPAAHKVVKDKAVEATCAREGKTAGSHCSVCNAVISEQETLPVKEHIFDNGKITKNATCTENGVKTYTCINCDETKTKIILAGHDAVADRAVAATCTTPGLTVGIHCSVCDAVIKEQKVVPATGHSYDAGRVTKQATCSENGVKTYTCTICGETKSETISKKDHTAVIDKAVSATCTSAGKTAGSHCSVCNTIITEQNVVSPTGHSYDTGKVTKAATCTVTGVKTYTCTKCKSTKTETISATGHSYDTGKVTKAATCTVTGVKTYTCAKCKSTKTEIIPATGHTVVTDKAIAKTCTKAGKTEGSHCSVCNVVIKEQETLRATGHNYDNGKVTKKATCTANGVEIYTCTVCKATKTETIKATGHNPVTDKAVAATCTTA